MGKVGLEWLYRLSSEPKRLWKRYLVEPWFLSKLLLLEILNIPNQAQQNAVSKGRY